MIEDFLNRCENREYISEYLYNYIKQIIPCEFDLVQYNNEVLNRNYMKYKDYFDNMYSAIDSHIKLDEEQIKAILADEDYALILAGAGTGKTTTMSSKVKYLVDIKKVNPDEILVLSYTKKTTMELYERIKLDFGIDANIVTFHSLGLNYIREIFNKNCYVVDDIKRRNIFISYFKEKIFPKKEVIKEITELFNNDNIGIEWLFSKHFLQECSNYKKFDDYFEDYKEYKYRSNLDIEKIIHNQIEHDLNAETIHTINNEIVRSKGEALIANFLFCNSIIYEHEQLYEELMPEKRTYQPDFTLYLNGEKVYLEYFGLYNPDNATLRYNANKKQKEQFHLEKHNKFISLDYMPEKELIQTLKEKLIKNGFKLIPKSKKQIYFSLLDRNKTSEIYPFMNFMYNMVDIFKASINRQNISDIVKSHINEIIDNSAKEKAIKQFNYIYDFYKYYQSKLFDDTNYGFDFCDMIYYVNKYIEKISSNNNKFKYKYVIIDEYQDISQERYELTKKIVDSNHSKILAVGDDWQSIYGFSGSKVEYIYNFKKYFPFAKILNISKTYRNSQSLVNYAGEFIMRNAMQIKKTLISDKIENNPIEFIGFEDEDEYNILKKLLLYIHQNNPEHHILVLARNNKMINNCFNNGLKDDIGTKVTFIGNEEIEIDAMTIHKSKGLSSDEVILIGLNQTFPHDAHERFWLENLFRTRSEREAIKYAEERRLFYVALTRTKNKVYLLVNKDKTKRSPFINELYNIINSVN